MSDSLPALPYKISVLCYLFDEAGRTLLLRRIKPPNAALYSPIGGKLDQASGESPTHCAQREIREEVGLDIPLDQLHLTGIVSERGYEGQSHWLMFLFEVTAPVHVPEGSMDEGELSWHTLDQLETLAIPQTDREVIWPEFLKHRGGFFAVHLDCTQQPMQITALESHAPGH